MTNDAKLIDELVRFGKSNIDTLGHNSGAYLKRCFILWGNEYSDKIVKTVRGQLESYWKSKQAKKEKVNEPESTDYELPESRPDDYSDDSF